MYWIKGKIGRSYQAYLDANQIVEESNLGEEEKDNEKKLILLSRKEAFGENYKFVPPWKWPMKILFQYTYLNNYFYLIVVSLKEIYNNKCMFEYLAL